MNTDQEWGKEEKPENKNSNVWRGYLPVDCPRCGRRRLNLYGNLPEGKKQELHYMYIFCDKCEFKTEDWK